VNEAEDDARDARAQPNERESQSYRSIDTAKVASNSHRWGLAMDVERIPRECEDQPVIADN
jgi:hypothetical protein